MPYIEGGEFADYMNRSIVNLQDILTMIEDFRSRVQEALDALDEFKNAYD